MTDRDANLSPREGGQRDLLTISVEDYFHVAGFQKLIRPGHWYRFERRIEQNTRRALDLLDEFGARATFFTLGWVAEQVPEVIKGIVARGHEVATKGYYHRSINEMTPASSARTCNTPRKCIERATGVRVVGHRAARGTLGPDQYWALQILARKASPTTRRCTRGCAPSLRSRGAASRTCIASVSARSGRSRIRRGISRATCCRSRAATRCASFRIG
jgi:peptidoglycan/xylan/chitin deacetylase (PgdA/CDA1 family)